MSITTAARTTANATTEGNLRRDVSDELFHIGEPTSYPLHTLLGGKLYTDGGTSPQEVKGIIGKENTISPKYSVIEKSPLSRTVETATAIADTTTTTLVTADNTMCRIGDTLCNQVSGEIVSVYAVDAGGANLSIRRNLGSTSFQVLATDTWKIVGNAFAEGAAKASLVSILAAERERRLQIFKRGFSVTGTMAASLVEAGNKGTNAQWDEEMAQAAVAHKLDIENSWWMNAAADSTTNAAGGTVNLTRGIIAEIDGNSTDANRRIKTGGALTADMFFGSVSEALFDYGPRRKRLFADATLRSAIDKLVREKQRVENKLTKYGLYVQEVETSHGILEIISCGTFSEHLGDSKAGFGVVLDTDRLVYKTMEGRDSKYEVDIQTPGTDAREGQFLTECGLSVRSLSHHRIIQMYAD
jgi:hypothetical protein